MTVVLEKKKCLATMQNQNPNSMLTQTTHPNCQALTWRDVFNIYIFNIATKPGHAVVTESQPLLHLSILEYNVKTSVQ